MLYTLYMKNVCPICNGAGSLPVGFHDDDRPKARRIMAQALANKGYSYREIMRLCGWKSVGSVSEALGKYTPRIRK